MRLFGTYGGRDTVGTGVGAGVGAGVAPGVRGVVGRGGHPLNAPMTNKAARMMNEKRIRDRARLAFRKSDHGRDDPKKT